MEDLFGENLPKVDDGKAGDKASDKRLIGLD
jgi:hypothetical protein